MSAVNRILKVLNPFGNKPSSVLLYEVVTVVCFTYLTVSFFSNENITSETIEAHNCLSKRRSEIITGCNYQYTLSFDTSVVF